MLSKAGFTGCYCAIYNSFKFFKFKLFKQRKKYHLYFDNCCCSISPDDTSPEGAVCLWNDQGELQGLSHRTEDEWNGKDRNGES